MGRKKQTKSKSIQLPQLPNDALSRITLGDSFAEYDLVLNSKNVFVSTAAFLAAADPSRNKCFFIGRRGTGKTAITLQLSKSPGKVLQIFPEVFAPLNTTVDSEAFLSAHQKAFRSVAIAFELTLQFELLYDLLKAGKVSKDDLPDFVVQELGIADNEDFDLRVVRFVTRILGHLQSSNDKAWLKDIKRSKNLADAINKAIPSTSKQYTLIIDRLDESWNGTPLNVSFLAALMHACGEFTTRLQCGRALLFLRENVFERVRKADSEFARLETRVVSLSWSQEQLVECIERRLNAPFNSRWPLGGATWNVFFANPVESKQLIFDYCQNRPRDILTYLKFAIETASSKQHKQIEIDDILSARKRFSDSRLKDLGDEYDENYPRIMIVLSKFYGQGWRFTRQGLESLLQNLLVLEEVNRHCGSWFFSNSTTEDFVNVLFQIGFLGIVDNRGEVIYRSIGAETTMTPAITSATDFEVHPMYRDALDLQNIIVNTSISDFRFGTSGYLGEIPEGMDITTYTEKINDVESRLDSLKPGRQDATEYENVVGEIIRLCFFRSLVNVAAKSRSFDSHTIKDWIASNRAYGGFWEMIRYRWNASQVIWECKNYIDLKAEDFHQMAYYTNDSLGNFAIVVFRGQLEPKYYPHLNRILKDKKTFVLLLGDRDLKVFLRQAKAGKVKESHIQDRYDQILREIG
jgi:hypothetical protein